MQIVAWLVAALVIVINGYLLLDFFSSEVSGIIFTTVVCAFTGAYLAFIVYLVYWGFTLSARRLMLSAKLAQGME